ncbi:capsular polysaccharide biosynthesis protein [Luteolibacter yonseiensis]|nr:hypothetical protein [Luteolibacter yonseiensis]
MEDAFVRSGKPGKSTVYGLVADSKGIYYDASGNSDLVTALETGESVGWMDRARSRPDEVESLLAKFRETRASKYNWYPGDFRSDWLPGESGVMVVDQTKGDKSLECGAVAPSDFDRMVRDALDEHPTGVVYLRAHPDHRYRGKHSCFSPWVFEEPRVRLLPPDISPARCFEFCDEIYAATSLMGMEGLIHGRRVKTYGWNFYAGWGLTEDRCRGEVARRRGVVSLSRLFEAAYLQYCHYFDPDSGEPCGLERVLDHVALQHSISAEDAGSRVTVGWTPWQRALAAGFFSAPGTELMHADSTAGAVEMMKSLPGGKCLLWGGAPASESIQTPVVRVEDGFLRSSGLGATFHKPLSWVVDDEGIYFDPRTPSRLESILEKGSFTFSEMADARELLQFLREKRLTKYNVGAHGITWDGAMAQGRKVILVPGQVEADASIKAGSPDIKSNGELLRRVRQLEPEAYLIFKAHPDLVAGARHGKIIPDAAAGVADLIVTEGNVLDWLDICDVVHTMTSTVGFEAILRQVPVVTHGMPFYAGWGLTLDHLACGRRSRRLTVEELVCGALIRYPRYLNPLSGEFTTALQVAKLIAGGVANSEPPWYLQGLSILKHGWVKMARRGHP